MWRSAAPPCWVERSPPALADRVRWKGRRQEPGRENALLGRHGAKGKRRRGTGDRVQEPTRGSVGCCPGMGAASSP